MSNTPITDKTDVGPLVESHISSVNNQPSLDSSKDGAIKRRGTYGDATFVPKTDEVYYTWERINFSVPLRANEIKMLEERAT